MGAIVGAVVSDVIGGGILGTIGGTIAAGVTNNLIGGGGSSGSGGGQPSGTSGSTNTASNSGSGSSGTSNPSLSPNLTAQVVPGSSLPASFDPSFGQIAMSNTDVPVMHAAEGGEAEAPDTTPTWLNLPHRIVPGTQLSPIHGGHANLGEMFPHFAEGGHIPEFYSEGGLQHAFVKGGGNGTSDSVPAMLATGEFVIPADVVSALGNGSSDAGSHALDGMLKNIRKHRQSNTPDELPPDSKSPLDYLAKHKEVA